MEKQNNIVTLTKAIGIILMVIGHALPKGYVAWEVIYTFHMPLFFICAICGIFDGVYGFS